MKTLLWVVILLPSIPAGFLILMTFVNIPAFEPFVKTIAPTDAVDYASWNKKYSLSIGSKATLSINLRTLHKFVPATILIALGLVLYLWGAVKFLCILK